MSLVKNTNIDTNFWEANPEIKYMRPFDEIYKNDKSKTKTKSSLQLWSCWMFCDPGSSKFRLPEVERREEIIVLYLKDKKLFPSKDIISAYRDKIMSQAEKSLNIWEEKLRERDKFLQNTSYDVTTVDMLDKMMKDSKVIWDHYGKVRSEYEKEKSGATLKGGRRKSKSEKGEI